MIVGQPAERAAGQMWIQKTVWDKEDEAGCSGMFFRGEASVQEGAALKIPKGAVLSFDTYFNLFSVGKWKKYTMVRKAAVSVSLSGRGCVSLVGFDEREPGREYIISRKEYNCPDRSTVAVCDAAPLEELYDFCFLRVEAWEESFFWGGGAAAEKECGEELRLACCICTYRKEDFVRRNVELILEGMADGRCPSLDGRLEIYIIDNGESLPGDLFAGHPCIHILPNRNYGGSAGFARGMMEAVLYREGEAFTHLILMDDDILVLPETLERTYSFLRLLKEEYRQCILGGSMLLLENKSIQAEACGWYDASSGENRISQKSMLDLSVRENLVLNERHEETNFGGWWYACIPASFVREKKLPLPLFLHRDDQEYGLRSGREVLQFGGIGVWHPTPAGKHADYIYYYDQRNMLIVGILGYSEAISGRRLKRLLTANVIKRCLGYRYNSAFMALKGCEDFCRGPVRFLETDPKELHEKLTKQSVYEWVDLPDPLPEADVRKAEDERHLSAAVKLWRYLFPSGKTCYAQSGCNYPSYLGHKRVVYLNPGGDRGYLLAPSARATAAVAKRLVQVCRLIDRAYGRACADWAEKAAGFQEAAFWEKYLGLDGREKDMLRKDI